MSRAVTLECVRLTDMLQKVTDVLSQVYINVKVISLNIQQNNEILITRDRIEYGELSVKSIKLHPLTNILWYFQATERWIVNYIFQEILVLFLV